MRKMVIMFLFIPAILKAQPGKPITQYGPHEVLDAIIWVETRTGANAYNRDEPEAIGILQQFPVFVRDVNRIIGDNKFTLDDRLIPEKAVQMFWIYQTYYNPELNAEKMIRIQAGGPDGMEQECTNGYFNLIVDELISRRRLSIGTK